MAACCTFYSPARLGGSLQALLSLLSDVDVSPLSTEIFLIFAVVEEGMEIFVEAVAGSERP